MNGHESSHFVRKKTKQVDRLLGQNIFTGDMYVGVCVCVFVYVHNLHMDDIYMHIYMYRNCMIFHTIYQNAIL